MSTRITGARVLLADELVETDLVVEAGSISEIGGAARADRTIDGRGLLLAPALIDIHGDAFERQVMPRPGVFFPTAAALLETDRQLAANGIATAYHALTLSWEPGLRTVVRGAEIIAALDALRPRLTVENRVQLRWETFAFEGVELIGRALESDLTPAVAFNDHTSMTMRDRSLPLQQRPFEHSPAFRVADPDDPAFPPTQVANARRAGVSVADYVEALKSIWQRRPEVQDVIAKVADLARARAVPMLSHDDSQDETRSYYRALGATIAEFPMSKAVAGNARAAGDATVFGAPNIVRGGSHIGSPDAAEMVEAGLCDVLASDYFHPAMLAAVARLVDERGIGLQTAWALVSSGPARVLKLADRGVIAPGMRADLVLVDWPAKGTPAIKMTMSAGRIAYFAEH
jgi:alpha-D-ribose 1-methylphosphonate 5-triphosphate diphosphatase